MRTIVLTIPLLLSAALVAIAPPVSATSATCSDSSALVAAGVAVHRDDGDGNGSVECTLSLTCPPTHVGDCDIYVEATATGEGRVAANAHYEPSIFLLEPLDSLPFGTIAFCYALTDIPPTLQSECTAQNTVVGGAAPGETFTAMCSASDPLYTTARNVVLSCFLGVAN